MSGKRLAAWVACMIFYALWQFVLVRPEKKDRDTIIANMYLVGALVITGL